MIWNLTLCVMLRSHTSVHGRQQLSVSVMMSTAVIICQRRNWCWDRYKHRQIVGLLAVGMPLGDILHPPVWGKIHWRRWSTARRHRIWRRIQPWSQRPRGHWWPRGPSKCIGVSRS